jgi:tRNA G18 (ribose-2'-O)-methylase SpoU
VRIDPVGVTAIDDPRVDAYLRLTDMDLRQRIEPERGFFMAEGHLVIERCVSRGLNFLSVLTASRWLDRLAVLLEHVDVDVLVADEPLLHAITGYRVHRGALAVVARPPATSVDELLVGSGDVLVLEELVDPTNVGLAIRSAVVQEINLVLLSPGCADPLYRRAVKSSMGAVLRCHWARSTDWAGTLTTLCDRRRVVALSPEGVRDIAEALEDVAREPVALLLGSEGPGLSPEALRSAWCRARIPMASGEDSLNVAAATAVACYERARSRRAP